MLFFKVCEELAWKMKIDKGQTIIFLEGGLRNLKKNVCRA